MKKSAKIQQKNSQSIEVYLVIGEQNSGKSSTISALTGVRKLEPKWRMLYVAGASNEHTFVHPRSLQEYPKTPSDFVKEVRAAKVKKVIVALREHRRGVKYPDAQGYADHFEKKAKWIIVAQASLNGASPVTTRLVGPIAKVKGHPRATNETAADIRKIWGLP